jgi:predicted nucleic acid-binding protein
MILTDAGPLVAILDAGEQYHLACVECSRRLAGPMITTWPAFSEAMFLLTDVGGDRAQQALWQLVKQKSVVIASQDDAAMDRMQVLMQTYHDLPMDLADASLVALAEERGLREIFTLDRRDFQIYRPKGRWRFQLWPQEL